MFTGIIQETAAVLSFDRGKLTLERPASFDDLVIGASIAVSGVCLTVTRFDEKTMCFDVVPETVQRSTFSSIVTHDRVNLERALRASDRLDGHVVQGHVEGVGEVCEVQKVRKVKEAEKDGDVDGRNIVIRIPAALVPCVVPKGSIAIDGVSLTVAAVDGDRATIALVPHTLTHTTLGQLRQNARVNLETDVLVRALVWRKDAGVS